MGAYAEYGYTNFWKLYGTKIIEIDEKIITPTLQKLGITPTDKWRWDSNSIDFDTATVSGYLQILIDFENDKPVIMVYHGYPDKTHSDGTHEWICEGRICLPKNWQTSQYIKNLRKSLKEILKTAKSR